MHTKNQNIIISGGSKGLGLHLVKELLNQANYVSTFARSITADIKKLQISYPDKFYFECLDTTDYAKVSRFFSKVNNNFGTINSLINNAAIGQDQLLVHADLETIHKIIDINIIGPTIVTRAAIKHMMINGGGNICNISSICGSRGYTGLSVYAGSKGYIDAMTKSLAREVGESGIFINSVAPGFFESEMSSVLRPEQLESIKKRTPSGKLSNEENIFQVVDLLISGTTNIQGQTIYVDGGIII